jgi:hypothetical protein
MSSQVLKQPTCLISVPSRELHRTHLSCSFQKACLLSHREVFINALSISYSRFLAEPRQGWSKIAWKVQTIPVMLVERWLFSSQKCAITPIIRKSYHLYFVYQNGDQDKDWAPYICCNTCAANLRSCLSRKRLSMPFVVHMV